MSKMTKPVVLIVAAIAVAAGAAFFLSRQPVEVPESSAAVSLAGPVDGLISNAALSGGGGTSRGPENAPITLVEFGDYQCPSCKAYHPIVQEVLARYPNQVRLEFHHYPLVQIHPNAMAAHMAAEAAGQQGRYWEMHDLLFETQSQWSQAVNPEPEFLTLANRLGLNANLFMQAVRSPATQQRILEDVIRARDLNVEAVPTFYLNGDIIAPPPSVDEFARQIEFKLSSRNSSSTQ
jgi:protein-disulfide isomerase